MSKSKSKQRRQSERSRAPGGEPTSPDAPPDSRDARTGLTWIWALAVLALTWFVFQPALEGGWLDWDDGPLLRDHESWRGLSLEHLRWMFTTFHMGPYQPLSWLSYAVDHAMWGMDPRAFHRTNVALHALSAACLFFVARRIFDIAWARGASTKTISRSWLECGAALSALFWSIHPLRVESVAWITERRDCLAGLFFNLALLAWLNRLNASEARSRRRWFWCALALFAASLLAKGLGMLLPLALLALDVWPLRRLQDPGTQRNQDSTLARMRALVAEKWPFFALAAIAGALAIVGQRQAGAVIDAEYHGAADRITQAFYGLAFYVRKTMWPNDLMVLYPMSVPFDVWQPRFVASTLGVVLLCALLVRRRRQVPAAVVGWTCYALLVAPVLGLTQTGSQLVADRYSYQACIALSLLAGGALLLAAERVRNSTSKPLLANGVLLLGSTALLPLALATQRQIEVWHDSTSLWEHDLAIDPLDSPARANLIAGWMDRAKAEPDPARRKAQLERALAECRRGTELKSDAKCKLYAAKIYDMLAGEDPAQRQRYLDLGLEQARDGVTLVERTLQRLPELYDCCGVILVELQRPAEAVPYFEKAIALDASDASRHAMLGESLMQVGRGREAVVALEKACRIAPDVAPQWLDLGDAHRQLGERDAAIAAYRKVIELAQRRLGSGFAADPDVIVAQQALAQLGQ